VSVYTSTFRLLIRISLAVHLFLTRELTFQELSLFCFKYGIFRYVHTSVFWVSFKWSYSWQFFDVVKRNSITRGYLKNCHAFQRLDMPCMKEQNGSALYFIPKTFVAFDLFSDSRMWLAGKSKKAEWCCRCLSWDRDANAVECCLTSAVMHCANSTALIHPLNSQWRIHVAPKKFAVLLAVIGLETSSVGTSTCCSRTSFQIYLFLQKKNVPSQSRQSYTLKSESILAGTCSAFLLLIIIISNYY